MRSHIFYHKNTYIIQEFKNLDISGLQGAIAGSPDYILILSSEGGQFMKYRYLWIYTFIISISIFSVLVSDPGKNGSNPGCSGSNCHSYKAGGISVTTDGLQAQITMANVTSGERVAGELVNSSRTVVNVANASKTNPFTLTASEPGTYVIYAGYKSPSRQWDSVLVDLNLTGMENSPTSGIPTEPHLYDNHPNPFNNETVIRFSLPQQEQVQLKIINISGQVVRNLVNTNLSAGIHSVRWDGRDEKGMVVASGLYLYQLKANGNQLTKRLILAK